MKNMSSFFKFFGINNETINTKIGEVEDYEKWCKEDAANRLMRSGSLYIYMNGFLKKMVKFMDESMRLDNKTEEVFCLFKASKNTVILANNNETRSLEVKGKFEDIGREIIFYEKAKMVTSRFKDFQMEYIVEGEDGSKVYVSASPKAMDLNGFDEFCGIRFRVIK